MVPYHTDRKQFSRYVQLITGHNFFKRYSALVDKSDDEECRTNDVSRIEGIMVPLLRTDRGGMWPNIMLQPLPLKQQQQ